MNLNESIVEYTLATLCDALLPELLSGELCVSDLSAVEETIT